MYQNAVISVPLFCGFGGFAMHRVGFGDALKYFDRVRPTTVVSAFLGSGSLERRLLALFPGSVGSGGTPQAGDTATSSCQILFAAQIFIPAFSSLSNNLSRHLAPHILPIF
jgi:hypothetical protein